MRIVRIEVLIALCLIGAPHSLAEHPPAVTAPGQGDPEAVLFGDIPPVETAALYSQKLQAAPANVTVITAAEIRQYGYRTIGEALSNVRGFYGSYDGALQYAGVRGFNLPGDYNTRFLVMLNGHFLTDNVYGAMYLFGQDFPVDMDLIQRIEVVRGPSSALYGSNGIFATVNIFTRTPVDSPSASVSTELGSFGERKLIASSSGYLGSGASLLVAGSAFQANGRTVDVPGFGLARSVEGQHGYHGLIHLTWHDWSLIAVSSDRKAIAPLGWFGADYGNTGTSTWDGRSFVESSLTKTIRNGWRVNWRTYYDQFNYTGYYDYTREDATTERYRDISRGNWIGSRANLQLATKGGGTFTFGGQVDADIRNLQRNEIISGSYAIDVDASELDQSYGLFAQQEWQLTRRWTLFLGGRLDDSRHGTSFFSPRVAAIYQPSPRRASKFLYGRAFRDPSTFERLWEPSPSLHAERINTVEFIQETGLGKRFDAVASIYHYRLSGLVEGVPISENLLRYQNTRNSSAIGFEMEVRGRPTSWLEGGASIAVQRTRFAGSGRLPNSPTAISQVRGAAHLFRDRAVIAVAGRYLSARDTAYGDKVRATPLFDATVSTNGLTKQFDLVVGVRNVLDRRYEDPLSTEHLTHTMPRAGRTAFLKLIWRSPE